MKKKILFINGHLNTGGVEKSLMDILQHLDYSKYDVDLLLTEELGDYASQLPPQVNVMLRSIEGTYGPVLNVFVKSIRNRDWFTFKMRIVFLLMRYLGIQNISLAKRMLTNGKFYDCVIGFRRGLCTQIAAYAVNANRRIAWWHHGSINVDKSSYLAEVEKCHHVVAVSKSCCDMLLEAMPELESKMVTIYNILSPEVIQKKALQLVPYFENDLFHIVSVGGLVPEKHFDNAIYVAHILKKEGISFRWHLVGNGILREELQQKAAEIGVSDCFIFEGNQVNPYPYIKQADLFVHPSYVESFGIVVAEALTLGRPCVVAKSVGVMDFLCDGKNVLLTQQNPEDLAKKVLVVLRDKVLRETLTANARCPEQFFPDVIMKKLDDILEA